MPRCLRDAGACLVPHRRDQSGEGPTNSAVAGAGDRFQVSLPDNRLPTPSSIIEDLYLFLKLGVSSMHLRWWPTGLCRWRSWDYLTFALYAFIGETIWR